MPRRRWLGILFTAAVVALAPASAVVPVWSGDGRVLLEVVRGGDSARLSAIDAESGQERWRLELGAATIDEIAVDYEGGSAVLTLDGDLHLATRGAGALRRLTDTAESEIAASMSPAGRHVGWVRNGDLWAIELERGEEIRLTSDRPFAGLADRELRERYAWSPDSRSLAYRPAEDTAGGSRIEVVDLLGPLPRRLALDEAGTGRRITNFLWRFDARAIGVVSLAPDSDVEELALCHPEKLHCRLLASREALEPNSFGAALAFLPRGFLWGRRDGAAVGLHLFDTLGRERRRIPSPGLVLRSLAGVYAEFGAVVVAARRPQNLPASNSFWVLDFGGAAPPRELVLDPGETASFSPGLPLRARMRSDSRAATRLRVIENLNGLVRYPPGSPAAD